MGYGFNKVFKIAAFTTTLPKDIPASRKSLKNVHRKRQHIRWKGIAFQL